MNTELTREHCMSLPHATENVQWGADLCFKIGGKMFALMSRKAVSCSPDDDLYATWQRMAAQSLQNLPVLSADSKPLGVLDFRDALKELFKEEEYQERLLFNYVTGVGYR